MNTYLNSSFSKTRVFALAALLAGSSVAFADHQGPTFGGRAQLDDVWFSGSELNKDGVGSLQASKFPSGANLRRANIWSYGDFASNFSYLVRLDFATHDDEVFSAGTRSERRDFVRVPRAELRYTCNNFRLTLGQMYVPFGMEWTTEDGDGAFMERSNMSNAFLDRNEFGIMGGFTGEMFTVSGAVVQKPIDANRRATVVGATSPNTEADRRNDRIGALARLTISPVHDTTTAYHIGFNAKYKSLQTSDADGTNLITVWSAGPELRSRQSSNVILSATSMNTAGTALAPVKNYNTLGVELAAKWQAFHVQGEYMNLRANYEDAPGNRNYKGWYAQAGWVFHGAEGRPYNFEKGVFEKPVATDTCYGAWEVVARFSRLDLRNDDSVLVLPLTAAAFFDSGTANSWTGGVNWYMNKNVSFQANYSQTMFKFRTAESRKSNGLGVRAQFEF